MTVFMGQGEKQRGQRLSWGKQGGQEMAKFRHLSQQHP